MAHRFFAIFRWSFACFLALSLIAPGFALDIPNAGFEKNDGKLPAEWAVTTAKGEDDPIRIDNAESHSGKCSALIRHRSTESYSLFRLKFPVKPDTEYTASVWVKADSVAQATSGVSGGIRLFIEGASGSTLAATPTEKGSFGWKRISVTFSSGKFSELPILLYLHRASGSVWFDDLELVEGKGGPLAVGVSARTLLSGINLAKGKKVTMSKAPNYALCTDPDDEKQLTDGVLTEGYFWVQKSTVGWKNAGRVEVVVDLGSLEPIREIALGTAGGAKGPGVFFPDAVFFVSEDGVKFHLVGRKLASALPDRGEWYAERYDLNDLRTKGRYVAVSMVANGGYIFADEIEVMRGDFSAETISLVGETFTTETMASAILGMRKDGRAQAGLMRLLSSLKELLSKKNPALAAEILPLEQKAATPGLSAKDLADIHSKA
ncbi:MAG: carbohydrate binding domain-containing protein, partial [Spirochaetia bacterium]|nr:carbohydrate binding domain-containing protein [Spirochaetia bacterium]